MVDETTVAPAPEAGAAVSDVEPVVLEEPELTPDEQETKELDDVYERAMAEGEEPEAEVEPEPAPEMPTDLPGSLKDHWATMSEEARETVTASHRELTRRLAEQGKVTAELKPFQDELVQAMGEFPSLKDMKPADIVQEMRGFAQINEQFNANPLQAVIGLVQRFGLGNALAAHMAGQPQVANYLTEAQKRIANLEKSLSEVSNPQAQREHWQAWSQEQATAQSVNEFAANAEHWAKVESDLPQVIPLARKELPEGAPARDVLEKAYEKAVILKGLTPKAPAQADPIKVKAAEAAKSVNVAGTASTNPRPMTEEEQLSAAYDRAMAR